MKTGFSINMKLNLDENNKYQAFVDYVDTEENNLSAKAEGDDIEQVCFNLYNELTDQVAKLEAAEEGPEDMSDEEYIEYLEQRIEELLLENQNLKKPVQEKIEEKKESPKKMTKDDYKEAYKNHVKDLNRIFGKYSDLFDIDLNWI